MNNELLYHGLRQLGLLYDPSTAAHFSTALEYYGSFLRETEWFRALPLDIQRRYSFCIALNGMKFSLAAENFQKPIDREALSAAVCFILAGCLLDHLLDEGTPDSRKSALEKLGWEYCAHYFVQFGSAKTVHTVDLLYSIIASFLKKRMGAVPAIYNDLLTHMQRAVQAEVYTLEERGSPIDMALTADKSILFVVIGFELALYGEHLPQEWEVFFLIGDILRMIDDLCDAEQDMLEGRVNSLLPNDKEANDRWLCQSLDHLQQALVRLKALVREPFFAFVHYEIQSWTLSNTYLYKKTMETSPCQT